MKRCAECRPDPANGGRGHEEDARPRKAPVKGEIAPRGFYEEHSEKWKRQELLTAILDLQQALWSLQSRVELARQQADYGASHGKDAQDTLDAVLSALEGGHG